MQFNWMTSLRSKGLTSVLVKWHNWQEIKVKFNYDAGCFAFFFLFNPYPAKKKYATPPSLNINISSYTEDRQKVKRCDSKHRFPLNIFLWQ